MEQRNKLPGKVTLVIVRLGVEFAQGSNQRLLHTSLLSDVSWKYWRRKILPVEKFTISLRNIHPCCAYTTAGVNYTECT